MADDSSSALETHCAIDEDWVKVEQDVPIHSSEDGINTPPYMKIMREVTITDIIEGLSATLRMDPCSTREGNVERLLECVNIKSRDEISSKDEETLVRTIKSLKHALAICKHAFGQNQELATVHMYLANAYLNLGKIRGTVI